MMISLPEKFLIYFFLYFFVFLIFAGFVVIIFIIRKKDVAGKSLISAAVKRPKARNRSKELKSKFTEKLGEKVVQFMIEVANSDNETLVKDRIKKIEKECEKLNARPLPAETKEIISTVLLWSRKFNLDRHIREMKILKKSSQITYDRRKRDFKLLIPSE